MRALDEITTGPLSREADRPEFPDAGLEVGSLETSEVPEGIDGHTRAERVAQRAYELYLARGGEHGYDQEDWYEAEHQIEAEDALR